MREICVHEFQHILSMMVGVVRCRNGGGGVTMHTCVRYDSIQSAFLQLSIGHIHLCRRRLCTYGFIVFSLHGCVCIVAHVAVER